MNRQMPLLLLACLATILLPTLGCTTPGVITPPPGYIQIDNRGQYDRRFVSADNNAFTFRELANPKGATAEFWADAIKKELAPAFGYTLKESSTLQAGRLNGTLLNYRTSINEVEHTYLVAVFVDGDKVYLVEAGGPTETIAPDHEKLLAAMRTVRAGGV